MLITYLPLPTFKESVRVLQTDDLRETIQASILILENSVKSELPAAKLWKGYEGVLKLYAQTALNELKMRDEECGVLQKELDEYGHPNLDKLPPWFFDIEGKREKEKMMLSHQAFLLHKDWNYYNHKFDSEKVATYQGLYWPTMTNFRVDPVFSKV